MAVDDHGLEAIRKSAEQTNPGIGSDYYLKTKPVPFAFDAPLTTDAVTVEYPSSTVEVYRFRTGGTGGSVLMSITVTYTTASKSFISSVVRS